MSEVNVLNFDKKFLEIKNDLEKAKFIGVDLEFSALYPLRNQTPSLFDTAKERYTKLRKNLEQVAPIQVGLTAFNSDSDRFGGIIYNFYIRPGSFSTIDKAFLFQASTLNFLNYYGFEFQKFANFGIPFLNKIQETDLRNRLKDGTLSELQSSYAMEIQGICERYVDIIKKWYTEALEGDELSLTGLNESARNNFEILYFVHKNFRRKFKNLFTYVQDHEFFIQKVSETQLSHLDEVKSLEEELISNLLGFTKIFRLITFLQKPLVGHNLFQDILLMINSFEMTLPQSYSEFKLIAHNLFPIIFDTRTVSYEIRHLISEDRQWRDKGLESIFEYFKNGIGRHLVLNSPAIEIRNEIQNGKFHEAGWDSFCAGYIFIKMAYLNIYEKYPKSKTFLTSELIGGLSEIKNRVNVIRGSLSSINLGGEDSDSNRPPVLVIESLKRQPIDIQQISTILSPFGYVEVRKLPCQSRMALIAVDNFGSARRIVNNFQAHGEYQITQYSVLKHSPTFGKVFLGSVTISGMLLIWMIRSLYQK